MPLSDASMSDGEFDIAGQAPLPEGVQKEIIEKGDEKSWKRPKTGDELTVHYVGTFESDGSQFDSSRDRGAPISFTLGTGQVIKGWDVGIGSMCKGERSKLTIAPEYAYGKDGQAPTIPPDAVLIFEIELISWVSKDDLFGDFGAIKAQLVEGSTTWTHPSKGSEVCVTVKATSQKGDVIKEYNLMDYVIGSDDLGDMDRVVDKTLLGMSKDEQCEVHCDKGYVFQDNSYGRVKIFIHLHQIYETNDVSLLKDLSVMKKVLTEGDDHHTPEDGLSVTLTVESACDAAGTPLPGFPGQTKLVFKCCMGEICDELEGAARDMKKGERAVVTLSKPKNLKAPELGLETITANKAVFILEMTDFKKGIELWKLSDDDKVAMGLIRKDAAADLFKTKRFVLALDKYKKVNEIIGSHDSFHAELKKYAIEIKRTIELNKAACFLQIGDPTEALSCCNKVIKEDRNNVKALFRRAKAHAARNEHVEAEQDLRKVLELEPANAEARKMLPEVRKAQKKADKDSAGMFGNMCNAFGKLGADERGEKKKEEPKEETEEEKVAREAREEENRKEKEIVTVAFKIEYKPEEGEKLFVVGEPEGLGAGDNSLAVEMTKLPQKWEPPTGSGKAPPEYHYWEAVVRLREDIGRVEYKYMKRSADGTDRLEEGAKHKCDLTGMGGSRVRNADSWRGEGR